MESRTRLEEGKGWMGEGKRKTNVCRTWTSFHILEQHRGVTFHGRNLTLQLNSPSLGCEYYPLSAAYRVLDALNNPLETVLWNDTSTSVL